MRVKWTAAAGERPLDRLEVSLSVGRQTGERTTWDHAMLVVLALADPFAGGLRTYVVAEWSQWGHGEWWALCPGLQAPGGECC